MSTLYQEQTLQSSSDELIGFGSPMHDRTYSESLDLTATRSIGEASSFMINLSVSDSAQVTETTDDLGRDYFIF